MTAVCSEKRASKRTYEAKSVLNGCRLQYYYTITKSRKWKISTMLSHSHSHLPPVNVDHVREWVCANSIHHSMCVCYNLYFIYSISCFFRTSIKQNLKVSILWITTFLQCDFVSLNFYPTILLASATFFRWGMKFSLFYCCCFTIFLIRAKWARAKENEWVIVFLLSKTNFVQIDKC